MSINEVLNSESSLDRALHMGVSRDSDSEYGVKNSNLGIKRVTNDAKGVELQSIMAGNPGEEGRR